MMRRDACHVAIAALRDTTHTLLRATSSDIHNVLQALLHTQVAAACLYIYCRQERKPYMLIDFSDHLSINIYSLGAVYLQLLRLFSLDDSSTFTKPVDPSLYLHRFVDRLKFGDKSGVRGVCVLHCFMTPAAYHRYHHVRVQHRLHCENV